MTRSEIEIRAVKAARHLLGWTQDQLANASGVGLAVLQDLESGRRNRTHSLYLPKLTLAMYQHGVAIVWTGQGVTITLSDMSHTP